ncbi:MAG: hypothetical protein R3A48_28850 [Polyangiales bacterium]
MSPTTDRPFFARVGSLALALLSGALLGPATSLYLGHGRSALAIFALPVGLVLGLLAWAVLALVVGAGRMIRQGTLVPQHPPGPAPGAWTLLLASPLAAVSASLLERVFSSAGAPSLALDLGYGCAHGALCYLLARRGLLDPRALGGDAAQ